MLSSSKHVANSHCFAKIGLNTLLWCHTLLEAPKLCWKLFSLDLLCHKYECLDHREFKDQWQEGGLCNPLLLQQVTDIQRIDLEWSISLSVHTCSSSWTIGLLFCHKGSTQFDCDDFWSSASSCSFMEVSINSHHFKSGRLAGIASAFWVPSWPGFLNENHRTQIDIICRNRLREFLCVCVCVCVCKGQGGEGDSGVVVAGYLQ